MPSKFDFTHLFVHGGRLDKGGEVLNVGEGGGVIEIAPEPKLTELFKDLGKKRIFVQRS